MKKPILTPLKPGDLVMILDESLNALREIRATRPDDNLEVIGIAKSTVLALEMWLGHTPVAEVEIHES